VSASVVRIADCWYVSITVDTLEPPVPRAENQGAVGVDLGIATLATLSTGEKFQGPKALRTLLTRLRQLSRAVSRKVKGSRNRGKARLKLAKLHARIAAIRRDSLHQHLARSVADMCGPGPVQSAGFPMTATSMRRLI